MITIPNFRKYLTNLYITLPSLITLLNPTHFFLTQVLPHFYLNPLHLYINPSRPLYRGSGAPSSLSTHPLPSKTPHGTPVPKDFFSAPWAGGQKPLSSFALAKLEAVI